MKSKNCDICMMPIKGDTRIGGHGKSPIQIFFAGVFTEIEDQIEQYLSEAHRTDFNDFDKEVRENFGSKYEMCDACRSLFIEMCKVLIWYRRKRVSELTFDKVFGFKK